jgi:hypothetical protein
MHKVVSDEGCRILTFWTCQEINSVTLLLEFSREQHWLQINKSMEPHMDDNTKSYP